jgi:chromosome segregation and condensation protein ScpB
LRPRPLFRWRRSGQVLETKDKAPIKNALAELEQGIAWFLDRAFDLVEVAGGWRLRTRPELAFWLRKLKRHPPPA